MRRRRFLTLTLLTPALVAACKGKAARKRRGALVKAGLAPRKCRVRRVESGPGRVLTKAEWDTLDAVCERIFPKDSSPGAKQAGVVNYIDAQLTAMPIKAFRRAIAAALAHLQRAAKQKGREFSQLSGQQQDKLLEQMSAGRVGRRYSGRRVMRVLVSLTMEGLFSDPIYGGNRDRVGWKVIGFVPQEPGPRCPYGVSR
jgi:hypothetical protein